MLEGANINKSLLALGNCINILADKISVSSLVNKSLQGYAVLFLWAGHFKIMIFLSLYVSSKVKQVNDWKVLCGITAQGNF